MRGCRPHTSQHLNCLLIETRLARYPRGGGWFRASIGSAIAAAGRITPAKIKIWIERWARISANWRLLNECARSRPDRRHRRHQCTFRVGPSGRQHEGLSTSSFTQIPSLLSRYGINNDVRDGTHQVLRWLQPSKSWSREELARRVNRSGIPMIPALLVRASALCHTIAALFMEQRASRKWPRFIFDPYQYPTASR